MAQRTRTARDRVTGDQRGAVRAGAAVESPSNKPAPGGGRRGVNPEAGITFAAVLSAPRESRGARASWTFLVLPREASARLPSRGQMSVTGTLNAKRFRTTLEPDGRGGHWMKVSRVLRLGAGADAGDTVHVVLAPASEEPEPRVPADLRRALAAADGKARAAWADITPSARRDFVHWVTSPKRAETRAKRIGVACDMLAKGKRRPCCFDRSGMYGASLSCPEAQEAGG